MDRGVDKRLVPVINDDNQASNIATQASITAIQAKPLASDFAVGVNVCFSGTFDPSNQRASLVHLPTCYHTRWDIQGTFGFFELPVASERESFAD